MDEQRSALLYFTDILESIEKIEEYVRGIDENDFFSNHEKQDAVIRRIEIIGEATKNIPIEIRQNYPNVPWRKMIGMRNIVVHEYFGCFSGADLGSCRKGYFRTKTSYQTINQRR